MAVAAPGPLLLYACLLSCCMLYSSYSSGLRIVGVLGSTTISLDSGLIDFSASSCFSSSSSSSIPRRTTFALLAEESRSTIILRSSIPFRSRGVVVVVIKPARTFRPLPLLSSLLRREGELLRFESLQRLVLLERKLELPPNLRFKGSPR